MCRRTIGMLAVSALAVSACGSTSKGATTPRPPAPLNVTVYIDNSRVSVSPVSVSAGPVTFIVTNQASQAESLSILPSGSAGGQALANTAPINPQATAEFTVNFPSHGAYSVSAAGDAGSGSSSRSASIHVTGARSSSDNKLLQP